jgi:hypothetical protein
MTRNRKPDTDRRRPSWCWTLPLVAGFCLGAAAPPEDEPADEPAQPQEPGEVEDEDLADKLIRQATGGQDRGIMDEIMRLMDTSRTRLTRDFDPGRRTQAVQQEIVSKLDEAVAAAQRNRRRARAPLPAPPSGDKRTTPPKPGQDQDRSQAPTGDATPDAAAAGPGETDETTLGDRLREFRRGWGHLPARDRDEVLQGIDEDVIEKYRDLVESYFKALGEPEE